MAAPKTALILAGHGSHLNPHSDESVFRHGDRIRALGIFHEVREAFWKGEPEFHRILTTLESERMIIVPMFMSNGYFVQQVLPREFGLARDRTRHREKQVYLTRPMGTHPALSEIIVARAHALVNNHVPSAGLGLALIGHGTLRNPDSKRSILQQAERVRSRSDFGEVHTLFLDDRPGVEQLPARFSTRDVLVLPLFMADGQHTLRDIPEKFGLHQRFDSREVIRGKVDKHHLWYARALGSDPRLGYLILQRILEVTGADQPAGFRQRIQRASGRFITGRKTQNSGQDTEHVPSNGHSGLRVPAISHSPKPPAVKEILPVLLRKATDGIRFDDLSVTHVDQAYTFGVPGSEYNGVSRKELGSLAAKHFDYVSNWFHWTQHLTGAHSTRWHFLRWLEFAGILSVPARYRQGQSGHLRAWGELLITTFIGTDGTRRYEIRHRRDLYRSPDELAAYTRPEDARQLAKYDADGAYRPLKSAPNLAPGWRFPALTGDQVYRVVESFYPASITDWCREVTHRTEITHFREAADRQSGMYAKLTELDFRQLAAVVQRTCGDNHCIKRRLWQESGSEAIDLSCGEGLLPCPAPCSVLLEAARRCLTEAGPSGRRSAEAIPLSPGKRHMKHYEKAEETIQ